MNSTYIYNNKFTAKDNILLYLKSKCDTWLTVGDINKTIYNIESNTFRSIITHAFKSDLLKRKNPHGLYQYKITDKGLEYLNKLNTATEIKKSVKMDVVETDVLDSLKNKQEVRTIKWISGYLENKYSKRTILSCLEHLIKNKIVKRDDDYDRYSSRPATYSLIGCDNSNNNICDNKTIGYQRKIDQEDIINYLNTSNSWTDPATVANVLGFSPRTHAGTIGHILSTMYEDGTILRKIEKAGARFYAHIDYVDDLDRVSSNELIETKDTDTIENTVQNDTIDTTKTYSILLRERTKYLLGEGVDLDDLGKICFEALQPEYDLIKERKHQEFIENKRTEQMKYLEDKDFIILDDNKKLQDRILDLEDKLNKIESKEMHGRAMAEHVVKNEIMK